ncbi:MAG: hypothetical protein PHS44_01145 [Candidatus Dojkabacteria bacterium]|nr:hypothetical protein [Candidatus Dojkabacteria bacterium]
MNPETCIGDSINIGDVEPGTRVVVKGGLFIEREAYPQSEDVLMRSQFPVSISPAELKEKLHDKYVTLEGQSGEIIVFRDGSRHIKCFVIKTHTTTGLAKTLIFQPLPGSFFRIIKFPAIKE